jgi:hypothetical protein
MTRISGDLEPIKARPAAPDERWLLDRLLEENFRGREEVRKQLADVRIIAQGKHDSRTLLFAPPTRTIPPADTEWRVPVDATMADDDGTEIEILLHVVDGYVEELEIYRVDGAAVIRPSLDGPLTKVNRMGVDHLEP